MEAIEPLIDAAPVHIPTWTSGSLKDKVANWSSAKSLIKTGTSLVGSNIRAGPDYIELE